MKKMMGVVGLVAVLTAVGCKTAEAEAEAPRTAAVRAEEKGPRYFPLVPQVEWDRLNWLQKTTASIAIVPGCILSACANACLWVAN